MRPARYAVTYRYANRQAYGVTERGGIETHVGPQRGRDASEP